MLDEKFFNKCTSNSKVSRSTSVSPQHFQDDKDTIKYLKVSFEEYKRKSQQTIRSLKRKVKQKESKLNKNHLDILEQMGKSNKELLKRMILKRETSIL